MLYKLHILVLKTVRVNNWGWSHSEPLTLQHIFLIIFSSKNQFRSVFVCFPECLLLCHHVTKEKMTWIMSVFYGRFN